MFASLKLDLGMTFVTEWIQRGAAFQGINITKIWFDDEDIIIHVDLDGDIKIKIRPMAFEGNGSNKTYAGLKIRKVVYKHSPPIGGTIMGWILSMFRGMIVRQYPFAKVMLKDNVVYLENVLTNDLDIVDRQLVGHLFIKETFAGE